MYNGQKKKKKNLAPIIYQAQPNHSGNNFLMLRKGDERAVKAELVPVELIKKVYEAKRVKETVEHE